MDVWMTILLAIGGNTALVAVLAYLAKSLIGGWIDKDLERHREQLKRETETALTTMRHELGLVAQEHALKASELQTRRAAVIAEIYGLLADVEWEGTVYVGLADLLGRTRDPNPGLGDRVLQSMLDDVPDQYAVLSDRVDKFYRYFNRNRIYLPEDTCQSIWSVMNGMVQATNSMRSYLHVTRDGDWVGREKIDALINAHEYFREHHGEARTRLEHDLRTIMGDGGQKLGK